MAKEAAGGFVVIFPSAVFPDQLLAERFHLAGAVQATDTNQAVGDVASRLDFDVAVAGVGTSSCQSIGLAPNQVFRTFTALTADVTINPTGARVFAVGSGVVFKGAVLGTPPDEIGAVFFLVFGFVTGGARLPDTRVGELDDAVVLIPTNIVRTAEFASLAAAFIFRIFPVCPLQFFFAIRVSTLY